MGRKNYLFAGSDKGGERAAVLYSLIGTAKLNGLDPESYLRDVLSRLPDHPINRIEELLPWNVVPLATAPAPTSNNHPPFSPSVHQAASGHIPPCLSTRPTSDAYLDLDAGPYPTDENNRSFVWL